MKPRNDVIEGWELSNPDPGEFDLQVVEVLGPCRECDYYGRCDCLPEQSVRRLVPRKGRLVLLSADTAGAEEMVKYYALISGSGVRFLMLRERKYSWDTARFVHHENVPGHALSNLSIPGDARVGE